MFSLACTHLQTASATHILTVAFFATWPIVLINKREMGLSARLRELLGVFNSFLLSR